MKKKKKNHSWFFAVYEIKSKILNAIFKSLNLPFTFHFHSFNPSYILFLSLLYATQYTVTSPWHSAHAFSSTYNVICSFLS